MQQLPEAFSGLIWFPFSSKIDQADPLTPLSDFDPSVYRSIVPGFCLLRYSWCFFRPSAGSSIGVRAMGNVGVDVGPIIWVFSSISQAFRYLEIKARGWLSDG